MTEQRVARESEAFRRLEGKQITEIANDDLYSDDVVESKVAASMIDPQWIDAWRLEHDRDGNEYGVPVRLPRGQWDVGGPNALINQKRPDGGYAFTLIKPSRLEPTPRIECFVGNCRKKLHRRIELVEHVRTFHSDEAVAYETVLAEIQRQAIREDPRLQRVLASLDQLENDAVAETLPEVPRAAAQTESGVYTLTAQEPEDGVLHCTSCDYTTEGKQRHDFALAAHTRARHKEDAD